MNECTRVISDERLVIFPLLLGWKMVKYCIFIKNLECLFQMLSKGVLLHAYA